MYEKKVLTYYVTSYSMWYVYQKSDKYILLSDSYIREFLSFTRVKKATKLVVITNPITIHILKNMRKFYPIKGKRLFMSVVLIIIKKGYIELLKYGNFGKKIS